MENIIKNRKRIKFRASGVNALLSGGNELTEKQIIDLEFLQKKESGGIFHKSTGNPLKITANESLKLNSLIEKRDAPFEFGDTAKDFIEQKWLQDKYGARKVIETKEMIKGKECEDDSMELCDRVLPEKELRVSRKVHYGTHSNYFTGTPDVDLKTVEIVEDMKTPWDIFSFFKKGPPKEKDIYYTQVQVYMDLIGYDKGRLIYCLVNTPLHLIKKEGRKYQYLYGGEMDNPDYLDAMDQLYTNHIFDEIPDEEKVKCYEIERNDAYINKLKERVDHANDYYHSLSLNMLKK